MRTGLWAVVLFVGCWSSALKSPAGRSTPGAEGTQPQGLAKRLSGPYPTVAAYCATRSPGGEQGECRQAMARTDSVPRGVSTVAVLYVSEGSSSDVRCAIAMQTKAGWYVSAPSQDTCHEPGYIELNGLEIEATDPVFVIQLPVSWHTKNHDASADFRLATFCGMPDGVPACAALFVSTCETQAPASDCFDRGYKATWTIEGTTLTLETKPRSLNTLVPQGVHRLF